MENTAYAKRTFDRPARTRCLSADDPMEIQEVDCHRLNCLT
jgi:hypothetical protein